jgi:glucokinase
MGAMVDGHLLEGADGLAAELGHIKVVSPDRTDRTDRTYWGSAPWASEGRPCGCGARGCLEAYTGGRYLPELIAEQVASGLSSRLLTPDSRDLSRIHAASVEAAATSGDRAARAVWERAAELLGHAIGTVVTLFNPRVLVLGGGVLRAAPSLLAAVRARAVPYIGEPYARGLQVVDSALGDDAGVVGAALAVL